MNHEPLLLLLEQDLDDKDFLETLLADSGFKDHVRFFRENTGLLNFMSSYQGKALVLLDFNTYPETALDLLPVLKNDPRLSRFPVIVFSDSENARDIRECYRLGAGSYIVKSKDLDEIKRKVHVFFQYWMDVVAL